MTVPRHSVASNSRRFMDGIPGDVGAGERSVSPILTQSPYDGSPEGVKIHSARNSPRI